MNSANTQIIRESFGRVVYTHKTHEKDAEIETRKTTVIKWVNIVLTVLTSGSIVTTIITNETALLYVSSILSALTLAFIIFQLSFNPQEKAEKHRQVAKELWYIREQYVNLLSDINDGALESKTIISQRDKLTNELKLIYKFAPVTSSKAYKEARVALKINEELTFSNKEINQFLPLDLWVSDE